MTTVKFNDKQLTLTQNAYVAGTTEQPHYEALAVDESKKEYLVKWAIQVDNFEELEDQSEACDWKNPAEICQL